MYQNWLRTVKAYIEKRFVEDILTEMGYGEPTVTPTDTLEPMAIWSNT